MHWKQFATIAGILSLIAAIAVFQAVRILLRRGRRQNDLYDGVRNALPGYRILSIRHDVLHLRDLLHQRDFKADLRPLWEQWEAAGSGRGLRRITVEGWLLHLRRSVIDPQQSG